MRILVFGMSGRLTGGIETFLLNMNANMSSNCIFDYVIMDKPNEHQTEVEANGGKCYCITPYKENIFKNLIELRNTIKTNRTNHPVAYFNLFSMVHLLPVIMCKLYGYKIVLHAHNNNLQQKSKIYYYLHLLWRRLLKSMNCIRLTNSNESTKFMFGKNVKAKIIYNAIDVERFRFNSFYRDEIRKKYNIEDKIVIGFSGRLSPQKNPFFLVEVFKEFHKKCANSVLMIAGEGDLRKDIENIVKEYGIEDSVIMLGLRKDIEKYYQAFDLFLLPSLFEGLGIVLVEAQASGLPVVTSADVVPDIATITPQCIRQSLTQNAGEWASATLRLLSKCESLNRDNAYDIVKQSKFNIKKEAKRLEAILSNYGLR